MAVVNFDRDACLHVQFLMALDASFASAVAGVTAHTLKYGLKKAYSGGVYGIHLFVDDQLLVAVR